MSWMKSGHVLFNRSGGSHPPSSLNIFALALAFTSLLARNFASLWREVLNSSYRVLYSSNTAELIGSERSSCSSMNFETWRKNGSDALPSIQMLDSVLSPKPPLVKFELPITQRHQPAFSKR